MGMRLSALEVEVEIANVVQQLMEYKPQMIIIHGSLVRGDYHEGNDMDLVIIKETNTRFMDRIYDVLVLVKSKLSVEPLIYTKQEVEIMIKEVNGFIQKVLAEGRILYGQ